MSDDLASPLKWAVKAFRDKEQDERYALDARYLDGDHDLAFATDKYKSTFGTLFTAFSYNRCGVVVDAHTDRLHIEGFTADDQSAAEQVWDIWQQNEMDVRFNEFAGEGLGYGDAYLFVWPDHATGAPTIWPQKATDIRVHYSQERPGQITTAAKRWRLHDNRIRLNIYTEKRVDRYVTKTRSFQPLPNSYTAFDPWDDDGPPTFDHSYGMPIHHYANNGRTGEYGRSELRDLIPIQDALNKSITDLLVAMELMAYPQRVILGMTGEDPEQDLEVARFVAGVNRIISLPPGVTIDQFLAADIARFIAVSEFLDTAVSRVSKVPVHYLMMAGGFPSGRAMRTAEAPFVAKMEDRQRSIGGVVAKSAGTALRVSGRAAPALGLKPVWKSAAPMSQEDTWDLALAKRTAGMPFPQILAEAGYDAADIAKIQEMLADAVVEAQKAFDGGSFGDDPEADEDDEDVA